MPPMMMMGSPGVRVNVRDMIIDDDANGVESKWFGEYVSKVLVARYMNKA